MVPVLFCFDCLEDTTIQLAPASVQGQQRQSGAEFPATPVALRESSDPETETERLIKVGGLPDWIQNEDHPTCPECGKLMVFVVQVNSDEAIKGKKQVLMFGDCGKLYSFSCCHTVTTLMQCY